MTSKIEVGILGATGMVGQQFVALLANHPWFRVTWLAASRRSAGHLYGELPWRLAHAMPFDLAALRVAAPEPTRAPQLVFSALDATVAGEVEIAFAAAGHAVVSNARNHRMDALVPLVVPEINHDHLGLIPLQQAARGWPGFIVTNPNCSTVFLALVLAALRPFAPRRAIVSTLQALSGAGYPGVASLDALGNVIPSIPGEEEKMETETRKILGHFDGAAVAPHPVRVSAQCTRVPVEYGHTELVSVEFGNPLPESTDILAETIAAFVGTPQHLGLPSAPCRPIVVRRERDRPQPRLDVQRDNGMTVQLGGLRRCNVLDYKFFLLGHNTIRGAAGAAILNAELLAAEGWLGACAIPSTAVAAV